MDRDTLIDNLKEAASSLSYYNAAEGDCWRQEKEARAKAVQRFNDIVKLCKEKGIDVQEELKGGGYLI